MTKMTTVGKKAAPVPQAPQKTTDLVATAPAVPVLADDVPDYLQNYRGRRDGLEGTDRSDFLIPRLGLCQSLSPQRKKGDPKFIEGLEEGEFFNTVTGENYGDSVMFIPLFSAKNRIKYLEPIGTGIDCLAPDGHHGTKYGDCNKCKFAQFADGEPPECTEFKGWIALINQQPIGLSFKSTSLKVAKQLNSMIRMRGLPAFAQLFKATSTNETKGGNTYKQFVVQPIGFTPREFVNQAEEYFKALREQGVVIDTAGEEPGAEEEAADTTGM